jgi:hypothetical protein
MATTKQQAIVERMTKVLGFFIGIFGAMAIIGVFAKIQKTYVFGLDYGTWMTAGFIGEAGAFIVMGSLELVQAFIMETPKSTSATTSDGTPIATTTTMAPSESARKMMEKKVSDDLNIMMGALGKEIKQFGGEIHEMVGEMKRARMAVQDMRSKLNEVASGNLAEDAERLGKGMQVLGTEMQGASSAVEEMRDDLDLMLSRFRQFNGPVAPNGVSERSG